MTAPQSLVDLTRAGVSIWLDDLDRGRIESGDLARLIDDDEVRGVTTNPTIFAKALSGAGSAYASQVRELAESGASVDDAVRALTTTDVRDAGGKRLPSLLADLSKTIGRPLKFVPSSPTGLWLVGVWLLLLVLLVVFWLLFYQGP